MPQKRLIHIVLFALLVLGALVLPLRAQAGGVCGGTYFADSGDTVEEIAAICGTTASAIYAANPGISSSLYAGQALFVPGTAYYPPAATVQVVDYSNPNYNYPTPIPNYHPPASYSFIYHVQPGDTFGMIAARFGVSLYALSVANTHIVNINFIYPGQIIYVPAGIPPYYPTPSSAATPSSLSYGNAPAGTPEAKVQLSNRANGDVYISLQGTTSDGVNIIREYPVNGTINVRVPAGRYFYVAWVGGVKFTGEFKAGADVERVVTFFSNKVVVD